MGGGSTAIYPVDGPGGYQIFARTPVPIWDARQRLPQFQTQLWLLQPTDRIKFVPCSVEEFNEIERKVEDGSYVMNITGYQRVSLNRYKEWADQLDTSVRF
jgi:allophanate hydrolase subunit 1